MSKHRKRYEWRSRDGLTPVEGVEFFWVGSNHIDVVLTIRVGEDCEQDVAWVWGEAHEKVCALIERLGYSYFRTQELTIEGVMNMLRARKTRDRNKPPFVGE